MQFCGLAFRLNVSQRNSSILKVEAEFVPAQLLLGFTTTSDVHQGCLLLPFLSTFSSEMFIEIAYRGSDICSNKTV